MLFSTEYFLKQFTTPMQMYRSSFFWWFENLKTVSRIEGKFGEVNSWESLNEQRIVYWILKSLESLRKFIKIYSQMGWILSNVWQTNSRFIDPSFKHLISVSSSISWGWRTNLAIAWHDEMRTFQKLFFRSSVNLWTSFRFGIKFIFERVTHVEAKIDASLL